MASACEKGRDLNPSSSTSNPSDPPVSKMTIDAVVDEPRKLIPYDSTELTEELKLRAKIELNENEETIKQNLRMLREILDEDNELVYPNDDDFLLLFLRARKFDVKRAYQQIKGYFNSRRKYNECYDNLDIRTVQKVIRQKFVGFLPYRDPEGCVVLIIKSGKWNPREVTMTEVMRTLTCGLMQAIVKPPTQITGFRVIVDYKGVSFNHMMHLPPGYLWLLADALQNCFPARFRAVHVVNEGSLWSWVWMIIKQGLSKKLKERFHFHGKNINKLHEHFPTSILPEEYGGELGPFDTVEWEKDMTEFASYLVDLYTNYGYKKI